MPQSAVNGRALDPTYSEIHCGACGTREIAAKVKKGKSTKAALLFTIWRDNKIPHACGRQCPSILHIHQYFDVMWTDKKYGLHPIFVVMADPAKPTGGERHCRCRVGVITHFSGRRRPFTALQWGGATRGLVFFLPQLHSG